MNIGSKDIAGGLYIPKIKIIQHANNSHNLRGTLRNFSEESQKRELEKAEYLRQDTFQGFALVCETSWKYSKYIACRETCRARGKVKGDKGNDNIQKGILKNS